MALSTATITYNLADLTGVPHYKGTRVTATTNIPDSTIADTDGNKIRVGEGAGTINPDGTGEILVWVPGAGSNPASWQTYIHVKHRVIQGPSPTKTYGPFTITADANLADLIAEMPVAPEFASDIYDRLVALEAGGGGDASDPAIAALVSDDESETHAAVLALAGGGTGVDPNDVGFDIILLAGQSNMVGPNTAYDALLDPTDPRIWQYPGYAADTYYGKVIQAKDGLKHPDNNHGTGVGPGMSFARLYASAVPANRRVLLIPVAYGGTGFTTSSPTWKTDGSGAQNLFTAAKNLGLAAVALHPNNRIAAILWVQGESDISLTESQYATQLDDLIDGFRTTFGDATIPFVIGSMVPSWVAANTGAPGINAAHADTPARVAHTAFTIGPNVSDDAIHYTAAGYRTLGARLFDAYRDAITNLGPEPPSLPGQVTGLSAGTPGSTSVTLTWTAVDGADEYDVEYKTSASGTWLDFGMSADTSETVTGLTQGTAYNFRVRAVNEIGTGPASTTVNATTGTSDGLLSTEVGATPLYAWSTRKVVSGYSGPAIRVRRSSDDTEQDIAFASGVLDTAALATFVGANSAYVTKWYNQGSVGTAADLAQSDLGRQARLVNAGTNETRNSKVMPYFDGSNDRLQANPGTDSILSKGAATFLMVASTRKASSIPFAEGIDEYNARWIPQYTDGGLANNFVIESNGSAGANTRTTTQTYADDDTLHQDTTVDTGSAVTLRKDGAATSVNATAYTRSGVVGTSYPITVGAWGNNGVFPHQGWIAEIIIWGTALGSPSYGSGEDNQQAFYATP